jgi:hypothetical protein
LKLGTIAGAATGQNVAVAGDHHLQRPQVFVIDVNRAGATLFGAEPALQVPLGLGCLALVGTLLSGLPELVLHRPLHERHKRRTFSLQECEFWSFAPRRAMGQGNHRDHGVVEPISLAIPAWKVQVLAAEIRAT